MFLILLAAIVIAVWLKSDGVHLAPDADSQLCGVCAGIAYRYGFDLTAVRIVWVLWSLCVGGGILTYLILWAILPKRYPA